MVKEKNFLLKKLNESIYYIKESKKFIFAAAFIFLFSAVLGYFVHLPEIISKRILELLIELLKQTQGMNWFEITTFIFFNNLKSSFFGLFLGVFFGLFSFFGLMANGFLLGFVSVNVVGTEGIGSLWKLFPHGIFEIPAIVISTGLGLKMGTFIFQKRKKLALKLFFKNSFYVFLFVVVPLLILAAIIEGTLIILF